VYDMYPWNSAPASPAQYPWNSAPASPAQAPAPVTPVTPATTAVQVALDRRDNGGDAAAEPTAVLARQ
jgi:hypothetical protein